MKHRLLESADAQRLSATPPNPRELGERLFAALNSEERAARLILAFFDESAPPAPGATPEDHSDEPFGYEALREAAIARLLLEHYVEADTQHLLEVWRAELPQLPESDQ